MVQGQLRKATGHGWLNLKELRHTPGIPFHNIQLGDLRKSLRGLELEIQQTSCLGQDRAAKNLMESHRDQEQKPPKFGSLGGLLWKQASWHVIRQL